MLFLYAALLRLDGVSGDAGLPGKQADAYLAGQTYLLETPPPALAQAPTPIILKSCKVKSEWTRFTDHLVFHDRFYLAYGPVPVLLAFAPYKLLFGKDLSLAFAGFLFASIGTLTLISNYRRMSQLLKLPEALLPRYATYLLIAGTFIPVTLSWPEHYQVYLMAAYAFVALGLGCFLRTLSAGSWKKECGWLALFSLCLGLAAGCRLHFAFAGIAPGLYGASLLYRQRFRLSTPLAYRLACLLVPWTICIFGLLYYNQIRFGSFFESGAQYQVTCRSTHHNVGALTFSFLPYNLYFYLLHPIPPDFSPALFKPIEAYKEEFRVPWKTNFDFSTQEPVYGLINAPFALFAFATLALLRPRRTPMDGRLRWTLAFLWIIPLAVFPVLLVMSASMRYAVDFTPWLMLLACLGYGHLLALSQHDPRRLRWLRWLGGMAAFYTLASNLSYGLQGYF